VLVALAEVTVDHPPRVVAELLGGHEILVGAGVGDLRAHPERYLRATRADDGWRFDGTNSWVSGWGLNSALLIAAVEARSEQAVLVQGQTAEVSRTGFYPQIQAGPQVGSLPLTCANPESVDGTRYGSDIYLRGFTDLRVGP
jgi:hypothetical protein